MKKFLLVTYMLFLPVLLLAKLQSITSSTFLVQDLEKPSAGTYVISSKDIKKLGIYTISQLLDYVTGISVLKTSPTNIDLAVPGFPITATKFSPKILINGTEITEPILNRTFVNNLPVNIQDIDRVEVIIDPTSSRGGYNISTGIINIVTRRPENLETKTNFTVGNSNTRSLEINTSRYSNLTKTFNKLSILYKKFPEFSDTNKTYIKSVKFSTSSYINNKRVYFAVTYMDTETNFVERYIIGTPFGIRPFKFHINLKGVHHTSSFFDLKAKNFDTNFYGYYFDSRSKTVDMTIRNWYIRNSTRYTHYFLDNFKVSTGYNISYTKFKFDGFKTLQEYKFDTFVKPEYKWNNWNFSVYVNLHKTRRYSSRFTYKLRLSKNFSNHLFTLGYSYNTEEVPLIARDFSALLPSNNNVFGNNLPFLITKVQVKKSNLKPYKFRTAIFSYTYDNLKFYSFYNLIYNTPAVYAFPINFNTLQVSTKSRVNMCVYGFLVSYNFRFLDKWKNYVSYLDQQIKDKTHNSKQTMLIYRRKFQDRLSIDITKQLSTELIFTYYSPLKFLWGSAKTRRRLDWILSYKIRNKTSIQLSIYNVTKESDKESIFGKSCRRIILLNVSHHF